MKHYIQYHNADKMGYGCAGISPEPLSIITRRPVQDIRGEVVWILCGEGQPRRYGICARFLVTAIESEPDEVTTVSGEGTLLEREIPLNDEPWFKQFLSDYQNFSLGFREIKEPEYIGHLERLFVTEYNRKRRSLQGFGSSFAKEGTIAPKLGEPPRADAKDFLSHLPEDGSTISNVRMMEHLGWDADRYQAVKARLLEKGAIAISSGRGGTVYRVSTSVPAEEPRTPLPSSVKMARQAASGPRDDAAPARSVDAAGKDEPLEVFIAYARKDEGLREALEQSLKIIARSGQIKHWHDREIVPGEEWQKEIDKKISRARVILLLISRDFLASDYCHNIELEKAMERHALGQARVIPIILRACDWESSSFKGLQVLPRDGKPVRDWASEDAALLDIERGIRRAIEQLR